jgi:hypothetical protein
MARGRRPAGIRLLDQLEGHGEARKRLEMILETLAGQRSIGAASQELGISGRRFHELRWQFLKQALSWLEPRPAGRRSPEPQTDPERLRQLEAEVQRLQLELRTAEVRAEIAVALPHLARRPPATKKTRARPRRRRFPPPPKPDV